MGQPDKGEQVEVAPVVGPRPDRTTLISLADLEMIPGPGHPVTALDLHPQAPPADPDQTIKCRMLAKLCEANAQAGQDAIDEELARKPEFLSAFTQNVARKIGIIHHVRRAGKCGLCGVRSGEPGQERLMAHDALLFELERGGQPTA